MTVEEPPRPERGATAAESAQQNGPDVSAAQQEFTDSRTWAQRLGAAANPKFVLSQADAYPPGIKQFLQFCLILVYPAWLLLVLLAWPIWAVGKVLEGILWVLFWPIRAMHKKNNPEEYAAWQAEQRAKQGS